MLRCRHAGNRFRVFIVTSGMVGLFTPVSFEMRLSPHHDALRERTLSLRLRSLPLQEMPCNR